MDLNEVPAGIPMIRPIKNKQGEGLSLGRRVADHAFAWLAFGCTFMALALLLLFFLRLGIDVNSWFKLMPERIAKFNLEIERRVQDFDAETNKEIADLTKEKETRIKQDPANAASLATRYDKVIAKRLKIGCKPSVRLNLI